MEKWNPKAVTLSFRASLRCSRDTISFKLYFHLQNYLVKVVDFESEITTTFVFSTPYEGSAVQTRKPRWPKWKWLT